LKALEDQTSKLKKLLAEEMLEVRDVAERGHKKMVTPAARREAATHLRQVLTLWAIGGHARRLSQFGPLCRPDDVVIWVRVGEIGARGGALAIAVCASCCSEKASSEP
jgi:hypothetical protein